MAGSLEYARARQGEDASKHDRTPRREKRLRAIAYLCTALSLACLVEPFVMMHFDRGLAANTGMAPMRVIVSMLVVWPTAGLLGLAGMALCCLCLWRQGLRILLVLAALISAAPVALVAFFVAGRVLSFIH